MGFRKNRSTLTALLQMYDRWVRAASNGKDSSVVLLDKDCLEWMMSYLTDRKQGVWIDHILSEGLDIGVGVPQGRDQRDSR